MANVSVFCGNFFNGLEIEKAYFSISNQLKKLPQKFDTLAIVSIFLPESFTILELSAVIS